MKGIELPLTQPYSFQPKVHHPGFGRKTPQSIRRYERTADMITARPPTYEHLRLTPPVAEALKAAGNDIVPDGELRVDLPSFGQVRVSVSTYAVTLRRPPEGLVLCCIGPGAYHHGHHGLRFTTEPQYPGEYPVDAVAWHEHGQWVPCPSCGGALVWYETGYVPGYRLCTGGHHVQLASNGRSAKLVVRV